MQRIMLKSKIHCATLTGTELDYEGSIAVDRDLLDAADILPGEQVHVLNKSNGSRLITYTIPAPRGSRTMLLNGPAARLGAAGDVVVLITYANMDEAEAKTFTATVILVNEKNEIIKRPSDG